MQTGKFVVCLPHASQVEMVKLLGSCSGHDVNKIEKFGIRTFSSGRFQMQVPEGCIGYIECEMFKTVEDDDVIVVFGRAVYAAVDEQAFSDRLMPERPEGKTLHHLGAKIFMVPGDKSI